MNASKYSKSLKALSKALKDLTDGIQNLSARRLDFAATMQHPDAFNVALRQLGLGTGIEREIK